MTYGAEFFVDIQKNEDEKTMWLFMTKVLNLRTRLEVLEILGRLRTGRRKGVEEDEVDVAGNECCAAPSSTTRGSRRPAAFLSNGVREPRHGGSRPDGVTRTY